jgi:hypothetical protein
MLYGRRARRALSIETCISCLNLVLKILHIVLYNVLDCFCLIHHILHSNDRGVAKLAASLDSGNCEPLATRRRDMSLFPAFLILVQISVVVRDISLPVGVPVESHGSTEEVTHESPCLIVACNEHNRVYWLY